MNFTFRHQKEEPIKERFLITGSIDYRVYHVSLIETVLVGLAGFAVGAVCGYIFYHIAVVAIITGIIVMVVVQPIYQKWRCEKRLLELTKQFKDMLENMATSISAGNNIPDALASAHLDLTKQYGEQANIVKELKNILLNYNNNINIEESLNDFAKRSGSEDIESFANVFETSFRKGGNMKDIIQNTFEILNDKITTDLEVKTMVAGSKNELNVMMCMPLIFSLVLNSMGGGLTGQGTAIGYISTTAAIILFITAYAVGKKMLQIKL